MASSSSPRWKCHLISLDEIKDATDNFNERNSLGHGGEGDVYLAEIRLDSKITQVAVKHLNPKYSMGFEKEIETVSKIQHPNLVSLLGYCDESGKNILLYEFMENGNLSSYVKGKSSIYLPWQQRLSICIGAARGLQHLHAESDEFPKGIIHRDVKPENILLDKNWVAKISDFGMLKLSYVGQMQSTMITDLKGTDGYKAPEYSTYRSITRKIDVYAFGVVLFQVLCLKMPWDRGGESYYRTDEEDLGIWAQQNVDTKIKEEICDASLKTFTAIIEKSLKIDPIKRPTMDRVVMDLENALEYQKHEDEMEQLVATMDRVALDLENAMEYQKREDQTKQLGAATVSDKQSTAFRPGLSRRKCYHISLDEIKDATHNFDRRNRFLGRGGSADVFLAEVRHHKVAVKRLIINYKEFEREIKMASMIQHRNLVSLLGYCDESGEKILLYEFMENGSLSSYIKKISFVSLSWKQRLCICLGAAHGLQCLHAETDEFPEGIVHGDVKLKNILLDKRWGAKIKSTMISTNVQGPGGDYAPDKYFSRGHYASRETDVHAFGVVMFQVLCLKMPWESKDDEDREDLGIWAQQNIDTRIKEEICDDSLKDFTAIVGESLKEDPRERPTMDRVVFYLENALDCQIREDEVKQREARFNALFS